jgi:hypothetical protein
MTVAELIEVLRAMPQDAVCLGVDGDGDLMPVSPYSGVALKMPGGYWHLASMQKHLMTKGDETSAVIF